MSRKLVVGSRVRIVSTTESEEELRKRIEAVKEFRPKDAAPYKKELTVLRRVRRGQEFKVVEVINDLLESAPHSVAIVHSYTRIQVLASEVTVVR